MEKVRISREVLQVGRTLGDDCRVGFRIMLLGPDKQVSNGQVGVDRSCDSAEKQRLRIEPVNQELGAGGRIGHSHTTDADRQIHAGIGSGPHMVPEQGKLLPPLQCGPDWGRFPVQGALNGHGADLFPVHGSMVADMADKHWSHR